MKNGKILSRIVGIALLCLIPMISSGLPSEVSAQSLGTFFATAYHIVYESELSGTQTVTLDISGRSFTLKASFLYGGFGVAQQGTGRTGPGGDYIRITNPRDVGFLRLDDPDQARVAAMRARYAAIDITSFTGFGNLPLEVPSDARFAVTTGVIGASGRTLSAYFSIAVDRTVIALGTTGCLIFQSGTTPSGATTMIFRADDTGGKIRGNRIDIYVGEGQAVIDTWNLNGGNRNVEVVVAPTTPTTCDTVDVILIIDSSGSMRSNDRGNKRLEAGRAYLTASLEGDFVGVVDFDSRVRLASPLQRLPDNKTSLINAINTIDSSGGTNIGIGVQRGCDALIASTSANAKKAAILLTDGIGSFAGQDACFSSRGWPIFTFGLGSADDVLLGRIASNTGGEFKRLLTSNLVCEFQAVRSKIAGLTPGPCTARRVIPSSTTRFATSVPSGQAQATFSTSWTGSDVVMTLTTPSGRVIDRDTVAPDVVHDKGPTFEVYTITNPEAGDWQVDLFGADIPPEGEDVIFGISTIPASNLPPIADAGPDQTVECTSPAGTAATMDGTGSSDPDSDPLTFFWADTGIVFDDPSIPTPSATFPLDTTTVTLTVTDAGGLNDTDTTDINVVDTTPPTLTVTASPSSLWPPNRKYVPVELSVEASDICDSAPTIAAVAQSSEPDEATGQGDGSTTGDIRVTTADGDVLVSSNDSPEVAFDPINDHLELRAERAGGGGGRTYTIMVTATDDSGNQTTATTTVVVPHDQRK